MRLAGQTAVVTGGSRGIGRYICLALATEGADVAVVARTAAEAEKVAEEVQSMGARAVAIPADVGQPSQVEAMVEKALSAFGKIDILVNNAGTWSFAPVTDTTLEDWNLMMAVNVTGTFLCCKAVVPRMVEQQSGLVINIASTLGRLGRPRTGAYSASKAAQIALTQSLAAEVAEHKVRVNAICPSGVDTQTARNINPNANYERWVRPERVADAVVLLATDGPQGRTGQVMDIWL